MSDQNIAKIGCRYVVVRQFCYNSAECEMEFGQLVAQVARAWPTVLCVEDLADLGNDACQR
jgi:hypothetical protein